MKSDLKTIFQDDEHWYFIKVDANGDYYLVTYSGGFAMETVVIKLSNEQVNDFMKENSSLLGLAQDLARNPENYNLIKIP